MPTLQAVKTFSQGLNQDLSPMNVPENAYVDALNITTFDKGGNQFSISNERGFQAKQALPSGYKAIGLYYIDNKIVCFSYNETTQASQVGYYDINTFAYTRVFDDKDLTQQFNSAQTFDFSPDYQIRATGRVAFNGDVYIYWVDGLNPPRWMNLSRNYFVNRFIDLNTETSLFSGSALVEIDLAGILESGNLTASSYQFAVRYQSDTGDTTPFSPLCNPIPIVDELQSVGRDLYNGAGQTENKGNKSIELSLSNVDTSYRFLQLAAVHYEGNALTPVIYIVDNIPITGSAFNYTYSGSESSSTTITTQELIQERAIYSTANQITQKNNRLFVGNLKETGIGQSLQTIANSIQIKYKIEEIQVTSAFTDYKLEENTFNKKGYRRDEAYAFGIAFVYTNGGISPVFHIPGPSSGTATRDIGTTDSNAEGTLGSTVTSNTSGTSYPGFGGYPSGKVRHHKMPSLQTEPSFRNDGGDIYIRILGIEVTNIDTSILTFEQQQQLKGYILFRATRDTPNNRSIISQGIYNRIVGWPSGGETNNVPVATVNPFFGNTLLEADAGASFPWEFYTGATATAYNSLRSYYENDDTKRFFVYQSPDTELVNFTRTNEVGWIKQELDLYGDAQVTGLSGRNLHLFCDFTNHRNVGPDSPTEADRKFTIKSGEFLSYVSQFPGGSKINTNGGGVFNLPRIETPSDITFPSVAFFNYENEGTLLFETNEIIDRLPFGPDNNPIVLDNTRTAGQEDIWLNLETAVSGYGTGSTITSLSSTPECHRYLVNLGKDITTQYGSVSNIAYIPIYTSLNTTPNPSDVLSVFNGDTFISKYYGKFSTKAILSGFTTNRTGNEGVEHRALSGYFVESDINCEYRHQPTDGLPFYPATSTITADITSSTASGVLDIFPGLGHSNGYNTAYSIENSLSKRFGPSIADLEENVVHPTRIAFSQKLAEGQVTDSFRVFLSQDFQDLPKHKGEITNLFEFSNILYAHTKEALWQTYVEQQTQTATDVDTITIATAGVFDLPPKEVLTLAGGYAGLQSPEAAVLTPFGYIFPDVSQGKVFALTNSLVDISDFGMSSFFLNRLKSQIQDKPLNGYGHLAFYDNRLRRYVLVANYEEDSFTVSFDMRVQKWISFHSYTPRIAYSYNDEVISFLDSIPYLHNSGNYGVYYNLQPQPCFIAVPLNSSPSMEKTFDSIHVNSEAINESLGGNPIVVKEFFDSIQCYNKYQNTGIIPLIISSPKSYSDNVSLHHNEFKTHIPRDLVINPNTDIFDINNLSVTSQYQPRMMGKYIILKLTYNNTDNYRLITNFFEYYFRQTR